MMSIRTLIFIIISTHFYSCKVLMSEEIDAPFNPSEKPYYRIMFWNVENLFDIYNDSLTNDDEFTMEGIRRWGITRYKQKINSVYKVLVAAGNPKPPEIIGLCEVENKAVLYDISYNSPFLRYGYKMVHRDSPDIRGIDVAVLYDPSRVVVLNMDFISPYTIDGKPAGTREIVYMEVVIHKSDTLHLFFNHWPSKYGGAGYTEPLRRKAAECLRIYKERIQEARNDARIVIAGDFNDPPDAVSLSQVLRAECVTEGRKESNRLYNLSCGARPGTHKYQGIWGVIDQFIVTGNMLQNEKDKEGRNSVHAVFAPDFLLILDKTYSGLTPFRTWEGMRYAGGYSDHLPVILSVF